MVFPYSNFTCNEAENNNNNIKNLVVLILSDGSNLLE